MALQKLAFRPGVNSDSTNYANEGGWVDCDKVRFRSGQPQKIGGWTRHSPMHFDGTSTLLIAWSANSGAQHLGVGTSTTFHVQTAEQFYDVTPAIDERTLSDPFETTNGSSEVVVHMSAHNVQVGQTVVISDVSGPVEGIPRAELNDAHVVTVVDDVNTFRFEVTTPANATVGSPPGTGGANIKFEIILPPGLGTGSRGNGWGAGGWGRGGWSTPAVASDAGTMRVWSADVYGEDLYFCIRDVGVFYWDLSSGLPSRAVKLSTLDADAPTVAKCVLVSPSDRRLFAFGCEGTGSITQDPLLVRWTSSESITDWTPTAANSAGELRITTGNQIITAKRTRQEILVWTDEALYSLQAIGAPAFYGLQLLADNMSIMSPNASITSNNVTYWMGRDKFYVYSGAVATLPCTVLRHVFGNMNMAQTIKVHAGTNERYSEIWWFYCSKNSDNVDSYVVFNYLENIWYYGKLCRTAWLDSSIFEYPLAAGEDGYLYWHEFGTDDGSDSPALPISAHIESSMFDLGEGDSHMLIRRLLPDVDFAGSIVGAPSVTMSVATRNFPGASDFDSSASDIRKYSSVPIDQYTNEKWIRLRGRHAYFRVSSNELGVQWQLGHPRLDLQPDGRRA